MAFVYIAGCLIALRGIWLLLTKKDSVYRSVGIALMVLGLVVAFIPAIVS